MKTPLPHTDRNILSSWLFWFYAGNALLFWLIGIHNLIGVTPLALPAPNAIYNAIIWLFLLLASVGQSALLALLTCLFSFAFVSMVPGRKIAQLITIIFATFANSLLIIDAIIFAHYHFHLNGIILQLLFSTDSEKMFDFSSLEYLYIGLIFFILFVSEIYYAKILWQKLIKQDFPLSAQKTSVTLGTVLFVSYLLFMLSNAQAVSFLTQQSQAIPFYNNVLAALLPINNSLAKVNNAGAANFNQPGQIIKPLHYPLQPLQKLTQGTQQNIVIIIIDAWRFDMLDPTVMPYTTQFAQRATQYTDHWSGGNATGPGLFSLFYGLPGTYWSSMKQQAQGPLLIHALQQQHYQMGIFASAGLRNPDLQDTVFKEVQNDIIAVPGSNVMARDKATTQLFKQYIMKVHSPFFGFVFYDAAHSYCDSSIPDLPFQPMQQTCNRLTLSDSTDPVPYLNRYRNALFFLDGQINQVITTLQQQKLLDNTIVIVTGDHGEEFNDHHLGYWGHAGNFTRYQVQTPLVIKWPKQPAQRVQKLTSHYDIAPTLLTQVLGYKNLPRDYCIGQLLSSHVIDPYLIISSYIDFGVIEKNRLTTIYPAGNYVITDLEGRTIADAPLNINLMQQVFTINNLFYSRD